MAKRNCGSLNIDGTITLNGKSINRDIAKISAYVQQEELLIGTMKVREHLVFQVCIAFISNHQKVFFVLSNKKDMFMTNWCYL